MKHKIKRVLALAAVMTFMFSTVVFAARETFGGDARAVLEAESSGGMKKCLAETWVGTPHIYASIDYWTYYEDGSEDSYFSGLGVGFARNSDYNVWKSATDYKCIHEVYNSEKWKQAEKTLYAD